MAFWAFISFHFGLLGLHFLSFWSFGPSFPFILAFWAFISFHFGLLGLHFLLFWPFGAFILAAFWPFGLSFPFILAFWVHFLSFWPFGLSFPFILAFLGLHFLLFWPFGLSFPFISAFWAFGFLSFFNNAVWVKMLKALYFSCFVGLQTHQKCIKHRKLRGFWTFLLHFWGGLSLGRFPIKKVFLVCSTCFFAYSSFLLLQAAKLKLDQGAQPVLCELSRNFSKP